MICFRTILITLYLLIYKYIYIAEDNYGLIYYHLMLSMSLLITISKLTSNTLYAIKWHYAQSFFMVNL